MRWRGVHHVEFAVLDYDRSIDFYDRMFGRLGYLSFGTIHTDYVSTYYMSRLPAPHSYIGIQPARNGGKLVHADNAVGIDHIALWARNRREVDRFHSDFLMTHDVEVTDSPKEYPQYLPGYYAVFFDDPINGIHWELTHLPTLPSGPQLVRHYRTLRQYGRLKHPELRGPVPRVLRAAVRRLPS